MPRWPDEDQSGRAVPPRRVAFADFTEHTCALIAAELVRYVTNELVTLASIDRLARSQESNAVLAFREFGATMKL
jgi:hypothetical protein